MNEKLLAELEEWGREWLTGEQPDSDMVTGFNEILSRHSHDKHEQDDELREELEREIKRLENHNSVISIESLKRILAQAPKREAVQVNLAELKAWVMEERDDHAINDALLNGFIVALCNKIDELTVKQEAVGKHQYHDVEKFFEDTHKQEAVEPLVLFSDRKKLAWAFGTWADSHWASYVAENVMTWGLSVGIIDTAKARAYLNKLEDGKKD